MRSVILKLTLLASVFLSCLDAAAQISGPSSVCAGSSEIYELTLGGGGIPVGTFKWFVDGQ